MSCFLKAETIHYVSNLLQLAWSDGFTVWTEVVLPDCLDDSWAVKFCAVDLEQERSQSIVLGVPLGKLLLSVASQ